MLFYRILADLVVGVHFAYVGFVVLGMGAILVGAFLHCGWVRNFWFRMLHLLAIVIVAGQAMSGVICPLTTLENVLRSRAGQATYPGAFVGYWAHRLMFFRAEPWVFTLAYSLFALGVLATFLFAPPRLPRRQPKSRAAKSGNENAQSS